MFYLKNIYDIDKLTSSRKKVQSWTWPVISSGMFYLKNIYNIDKLTSSRKKVQSWTWPVISSGMFYLKNIYDIDKLTSSRKKVQSWTWPVISSGMFYLKNICNIDKLTSSRKKSSELNLTSYFLRHVLPQKYLRHRQINKFKKKKFRVELDQLFPQVCFTSKIICGIDKLI